MKGKLIFALMIIFAVANAYSDDSPILRETAFSAVAAYYPSNLSGYESSGFSPVSYDFLEGGDGERDLGSTWGGAEGKVSLSHTMTIPALRGEGPLFADNNIALKATGELSPVSLNALFQVSLTPIAFLKFSAGTGVGTGFTLGFKGLAANPLSSGEELDDEPFGGAVYRFWLSGTFQFDFAALFPGDWNHVVFQITPEFEYKAYTGAGTNEAWLWEADKGENFNAFKYNGTYFIGYQMPLKVNLAGFLLETEEWLGSVRSLSPMDSGWGSDFVTMNFGPIANVQLTERSSLAILVQFKTGRDYTDATTRMRSFQERIFEDTYVYFNRIAVSYSLSL